MKIAQDSPATEKVWQAAIVASAGAVIALTVWCLSLGITTVFMHLYYIPLVLIAYRYRKWGIIPCSLLSLTYLALVIFYEGRDPLTVEGAIFRTLVFVALSVLVAYLAERLAVTADRLDAVEEIREGLLQNPNVWMMVLDERGILLEWNRAAAAMSGYAASEVVGKNTIWKLIYPDPAYRKEITGNIRRIIETNDYVANVRATVSCRDGSGKVILWNTRALPRAPGQVQRYIAVGVDISDQIRAEEVLQVSEHRSAVLLEAVPDLMIVISRDGTYRDVHVSDPALLAIPPEKIIGSNLRDSGFAQESLNLIYHHIERALEDKVLQQFEYDLAVPQGKRHFEARMVALNGDEVLGIIRDITENKRAETAIRESEEKFRSIFDNANDAIHLHEIQPDGRPGIFIDVNEAACRMLQMSRDELLRHTPLDFTSEYHEPPIETILSRLRATGSATFETGHRRSDGVIVPVEVNAHFITLRGRTATLAIIRDITERKRAQEALEASAREWQTTFDAITDVVFLIDRKGRIVRHNRAFEQFSKKTADEIQSRLCYEILHGSTYPIEGCPFHKAQFTRKRESLELHIGNRWYVATVDPIIAEDGGITGAVHLIIDISERKQAESALLESRQLFSDIISFLPDPTFVIDRDGMVLAWNRALEQISGVPAREMVGKGNYEYSLWQYGRRRPLLIDLVQNPDQDAARMNYSNIHHDGTSVMAETQLNLSSGKTIAFSLIASPLYDSKGSVIGAIESMRDITRIKETEAELSRFNTNLEHLIRERTHELEEEVLQRQKAEKEVQAALDYTRSVIEANPDLMVVLDPEGTILDINTAGEVLTGLPRAQLIGRPYFGFLEDDGTLYSAFAHLLDAGLIENFVRIRRTDGHLTPLSVHATVIPSSGSPHPRIIVSAHDITRQKQDEAQIQASLDEKVLLLREIHHRVKNNLQIIISLTNLQMRTIEDPVMKQILAETRNRVRAMSLVHEKLYMSENLSSIDLADYTKFLATQLFSFYSVSHLQVALHTDVERIPLDIDTAIPLGLILNELISNALKHAFPGGRTGSIRISAHQSEEILTVEVEDDGVGFPSGSDWKATESLGLRLITSLVDQLGGTIEKRDGEGTMFIITIHRKSNRGSST